MLNDDFLLIWQAKPSNLNEMKSADEGPEMSSTATEANGQQE